MSYIFRHCLSLPLCRCRCFRLVTRLDIVTSPIGVVSVDGKLPEASDSILGLAVEGVADTAVRVVFVFRVTMLTVVKLCFFLLLLVFLLLLILPLHFLLLLLRSQPKNETKQNRRRRKNNLDLLLDLDGLS